MGRTLTEEVEELAKLPELIDTPFPYRGYRDFRTFTQDDYDNFSSGVLQNTNDPAQLKWIGGAMRFSIAREKLAALGYRLDVREPHVSEIGNTEDGFSQIKTHLYTISFMALHADAVPA